MSLTSVRWVVDQLMLDRAYPTGMPTLVEALQTQGNEVCVTAFNPGNGVVDNEVPLWDGECVVVYGSHQFVSHLTRARAGKWQPGSFHQVDKLSYSAYSPYLGDLLVNDDFVILPYGEFRRRGLEHWGGSAFIRPNAVTKAFTGFVIKQDDLNHELNSLDKLALLQPEDLIVVARPNISSRSFAL